MAEVLDHGYCNFIEKWGSDERIIESARMSTAKGFQGWGTYIYTCARCGYDAELRRKIDGYPGCPTCTREVGKTVCFFNEEKTKSGDEKLLKFLYDHKHFTPFEMAGMTIEVQAPIMVFREWHRHRTQSYNEMSGRYTELPDLIYIPDVKRLMGSKQSKANKQGSEAGFTEDEAINLWTELAGYNVHARETYEHLLREGVSKEIARLVLPVAQYSRMRASANLRNWLAFLTLRTDEAAQFEIRVYANEVANLIKEHFPRTHDLWNSTNS